MSIGHVSSRLHTLPLYCHAKIAKNAKTGWVIPLHRMGSARIWLLTPCPVRQILPSFWGRGLTWTAGAAPRRRVGSRRGAKLAGGPIVPWPRKANPYHLMENDTVDSLAERVLAQEHLLYVETLRKISEGTIVLPKFE